MTTVGIIGLVAAAVASLTLFVGLVVCSKVAQNKGRAAFAASAASLGLERSEGQFRQAHFHWTGAYNGRDVIVGYYEGARSNTGGAGVLLMMQVGLLPGGHWGANLSKKPPKLWGRGEGREAVEALLTPSVLEAVALLTPSVLEVVQREMTLFPADDLVKGAHLQQVIITAWPDGWSGLGIRMIIPRDADAAAMSAGLDQLGTVADALK
jgi:hypothetical protein